MKETIIKNLQKFINKPFLYSELIIFLDKQEDILLHKEDWINDEYCALWDTIWSLRKFFSYAKEPNLVIGCINISIQQIVNYYYQKYISSMKLKNKKYQKVSHRRRIREPKRFPEQFINPSIPHGYQMSKLRNMDSNKLDYRDIKKDIIIDFLIKTGILIGKDLRIQRSQPNSYTKTHRVANNRKLRHQKLTNKYD